MPQMFFGQFLVEQGAIDDDALQSAIELVDEVNARVGELGVERGYLTPAQVELVQVEQRQVDCRFVDLAVQLELLSIGQADDLLAEQRRRHKPLGEALVELELLNAAELDAWLDRYHLTQFDLDVTHLELPFELMEDDIASYLVDYLPKLFRRMTQVPMKLQPGRPFTGRSNLPYRAEVKIQGDSPVTIGIAACPELARRLALGLQVRDDGQDINEASLRDGVREFAEILAEAGRRSVANDGLLALVAGGSLDALPKGGFWFPATTPFGRGILVISQE